MNDTLPNSHSPEGWPDIIEADLKNNTLFLYIKGEKYAPACGFSHKVLEVFNAMGKPFKTRNILLDPAIRDALSARTNWPTIPQVFINGEFIGGCDITMELFQTGELQKKVQAAFPSENA